MFEHDQQIVTSLLQENDEFKRLFSKHGELKQRVSEANLGVMPLDDFPLEKMKKEKLLLKDRMAQIIESYRQHHAA